MLSIMHKYIIVNRPSVSVQYSFMRYKASMTKGVSGTSSIICVFICVYGVCVQGPQLDLLYMLCMQRPTARPFVYAVYVRAHS